MGLLAGIGSVLSGIGAVGGLFGKKAPNAADNIDLQALGARRAAEKYGFNPLTLLQYGQPGGSLATAGGPPPLASLEFLGEIVSDFDPEVKADKERQRQADQLNLDLARLKLEQARSGVVIAPQSAVQSVGQGPSPLGRRPVTVLPSSVTPGVFREDVGRNDPRADAPKVGADPAGSVPLEVPFVLSDGSTTLGPNPNAAPDLETLAGTGWMKAKSMAERYGEWWMREAPPRYRSAHQAVTGKNPKTAIDAKRSAYGPQQKFWPF
ncbi:hypothetical protein ACTTAL_09400 [Rhodobacter capsulatus]|uniref:hypothetical protein n=1 Tax=Rhodobacter capsulatus TaxID=1061 RepID=UPI00041791AA|nr:hypothetical protein [Rhodobacter capsulatus]